MKNSLKCYECKHLIREYGDEPSLGGGCDNMVRCAVRPEVEEMIRKELKFYGNNGSPFGYWLCGQSGIDVETTVYMKEANIERPKKMRCASGIEANEKGCKPNQCNPKGWNCPVADYEKDKELTEWERMVVDLRDPAWEAVDEWLDYLSKISFKDQNSRLMLRREEQIVEDVLWRAQKSQCDDVYEATTVPGMRQAIKKKIMSMDLKCDKCKGIARAIADTLPRGESRTINGCADYCKREDEPDVLFHSYYLLDEKEERQLTAEDIEIDKEYRLIQEAEATESILTGHFTFVPTYGFFTNSVFHSAA